MLYLLLVPVLIFAGLILWLALHRDLPRGTNQLIREVIETGPGEKHVGRTGFSENSGVKIWYEDLGDPNGEPVLLIMGHSCTALLWESVFWQPLLDAGYRVIRFDNRSLGLSDWMENWDSRHPYLLEDMAADAVGILDHLQIEKCHLVGASMGGMIAQIIALDKPERVCTLTTIMSTGWFNNPATTAIPFPLKLGFARIFLKFFRPQNEFHFIRLRIAIRILLNGKTHHDRSLRDAIENALYEKRFRKGANHKTALHQGKAIKWSGSRLERLAQLQLPWLIIHGKDDPLILFEHALLQAKVNPRAKTLFIEGMGHTLPESVCEIILPELKRHFWETAPGSNPS
ncbi:MAG: alpha/beta hydrolase [Bacteroidia bacterium]|nr:alpha/beta hydrolase [Bacteroidia bacterium]